jgi:hypothetical protein
MFFGTSAWTATAQPAESLLRSNIGQADVPEQGKVLWRAP